MVREMVDCVVREVISWMASVKEAEGKYLYFSTTDALQTMFTNCLQVEGFRDSSSVTHFRTQSPSSELRHPSQGPATLLRARSPSSEPSRPFHSLLTLLRAQSPSSGPSHPPQGPVALFRAQSPSSESSHYLQSSVTLLMAQLPSSEPSHPPQGSVIHSENGRLGVLQCSIALLRFLVY